MANIFMKDPRQVFLKILKFSGKELNDVFPERKVRAYRQR